jgi:beta-galactosidase
MRASKQAAFLITETNAGAIGGPSSNFPAFEGQWRQVAWAFVARGAEMIEYWHHFGTETYWVGILPHDQQPGRVYAELSRVGEEFRRAGSRVVGLRPDAQIGLLYSARSKWGLAFQASFPKPGRTTASLLSDLDQRSYHRIFEAFYRGTFDARVSARLIHDVQIVGPDGSRLLRSRRSGRRPGGGLRSRRRPSPYRPTNCLRRPGGSRPSRGKTGAPSRGRRRALPRVLQPQ